MPIVASTHISASDNFQLGDSSDDRHVLHGHLSGSYTSTGSFGRLNVVGSAEIAGPVYVIDNKQIYLGSGDDFSLYHNGSHSYINNTVGNIYYREDVAGASHIFMTQYNNGALTSVFEVTDSGALLRQGDLTVNSNIVFPTTNAKISGSATSTGSFGHLMVGGGNFTSASLAHPAGGGGGSDDMSWNDGTATRISGSVASTGSFGRVEVGAGVIDLKNTGAQSVVRLYCESSNAHYAEIKAPPHSEFEGSVTLTLPAGFSSPDTFALLAAGQTFTNKTLTSPVINVTSDAEGDIYYRNSGGAFTRLAKGTDNHVLTMNGNVPNWEVASGGGGSDTDWYSGTNFITASFTPSLSPNVQVTGSMIVSGSVGNLTASLAVYGSGSEVFKVEGTNGTLFSVTDIMSGSIFSANLISGLPVIEAFSDNKVTIGQYADPLQVYTSGTSRTIFSGSQYSTASFGHYANISASVAAAGFGSGGGGGGGGNLTTKGDIEAYTTSQTRLAVGTNDYVLTADSSTAAGIAWKVAGGGVTVSNNVNNRIVTGDGSNANAEANLTFDGSTLTVAGDATVTGDIIIDDGGSLKEAGGTAAFSFDAAGDVTKIGQSSAAVDQVLSWNGSKAVWAAAGGGGSSIWTTTGDYKSTTSPLRISGSASEGSLVISGSASHPRLKVHGVSGNVLNIGNNVGGINTPPASGHSTGSMFAITTNFGITHFEAFVDGTFAIGQDPFDHSYTNEHVPYGKPLLRRTGQMFLSGSSPSGSNDYSGSSPTLEVHGSGSISYYQGLSGRLLSIDDDEHNYKPVSSSAPVSASAVFSVNSYFGSPLFEIFPDGTSNLFSNVWEQPILRRNHMMHLSGSSLPLASYSSEDYTLHVEGSGSIFKVQNEQSVKFNVESDAKSFNYRTGSILTVSDNAGVSYFNVFNDATFTLGTIADPIIKRNNSWHISSSNHNEETYSSNDYTVQIEGSGSNILAAGDSINTRFSVDEHDTLDAQKTILNISDQVGHPIISVRDAREGFRQATIITGSGGPFPTFTEHDRLLLAPQHWDTTSAGLGTTPAWHDTFTSEASEPIARSGDIIMLGTTSVTRGKLYHLQSATLWVLAGADVARSESNLLAVALDTGAANIVGMLVKGAIAIPTDLINGVVATGAPAYVSTTTAGEYDFTAPSTSGDRVRVVAYCLGTEEDDQILMYFDPDKTGITLS